ncbi:PhzF family phenazine biosynthesis protein [Natrarchaeobaculum sulfurireducens]|uniref:Epimerase, PhzC/PhzF-like protein n=1 Tax=Natrarchaeobaculum sulfurireducens TaxID=2044521 RepID=A0A346PHU4_9EURY|nr:PhzF family phenazine biosynthesis protein [Natrarchaeobaculum sulfurireducens]AXR79089.1 Epimerase, PhzC/PhzF-like protein [Natrarchaeobaculum sulfurireducens]AXR80887.1 putative epimerase, PhzC/PhzF [Natrarchaeobaculum sulfurireducens]
MQTLRLYQIDAFTDEPLSGNPAGVVPEADGLTDDQMQAIAAEMAVSETAFVRSSEVADYRLRYFTPTQEVDLCGHATIGSFAFLHDRDDLEPGTTTVETNGGVLEVDLEADGTVWMTQEPPRVRRVDLEYERVAEALGVDREALEGSSADLPLSVASTGLPFLVVPITYLSDVGSADPDFAAVEALTDEVDATGVYLFTFDTLEGESTLHGRMFAPGAGVREDPVTGTASGAVGAYLDHVGAFDDEFPEELRLEQGHYVDRPGLVRVQVGSSVRVGGRAVTVLDGSLVVPEDESDEILEA